MRTAIFYFTGTGNSLAVARLIEKKLGDTSLIHMASIEKKRIDLDAQRIGIVFPVYIFSLPLIVQRCIKNLHIPNNVYTFAVAVHGGLPCATLTQTERLFRENGVTLNAGFEVLMVDNATQISDIIPINKQKQRYANAELKINKICDSITNGKGEMYRGIPLLNGIFTKMYTKAIVDLPGFDKNFSYDSNCNGCGICEKVCPMRNIVLSDEHPTWNHACEQCMACFHWCPQKAIQYGPKTANRSRYHHPEISVFNIISRNG